MEKIFPGIITIRILLYILVTAGLCDVLFGGTSPKSIVAARTSVAPHNDGFLNDEVWNNAVTVTGFLQFDPEEGAPPTERTSVRILYDDDALYVGVHCYDSSPGDIVHQLTRRDRSTQADRFSVIIDSYHDHSTAFLFSGSVSGVQSDGILSQDGLVYDLQWDAVWRFDAQVVDDGWTAEFTIPYSALRFTEESGEYVWGINFRRYVARKKETDEWVMVQRNQAPPGTISSVSKMGNLSGMINILPSRHLEIMPYQVSRAKYLSQPAPFSLNSDYSASAGVDIKYGITRNFTFDMAINPDFGQVEVDQAILNLTVFETFYPEKRPFFLEGSQIFSFGNIFDNRQLRLFYSRRIGKNPEAPSPAPGYYFAENPQTTTILGAGKLTGRTSDGLSVGVLTAITDKEEGVEEDINGNRNPPVLFEPQASYNIIRLQQDISEHAVIGMMATGTLKEHQTPVLAGGVDWNTRFADGTFGFDGYLAGSNYTSRSGAKQSGSSGRIGLGRLEDEHWLGFTFYDFSSKNFYINDLGFYNQPNEHGGYTQLSYKEDHAEDPIRRYALTLQSTYRWNWNDVATVKQLEFEPSWEFRNFWTLILNYTRNFPAFDDANRGMTGLYRRPEGNNFTATLQTDPRQTLTGTIHTGLMNSVQGMTTFYSSVECIVRPNSWVELVPSFTLATTRSEESWPLFFYTTNGYNLFGDRDIDQYDFSLRGTITFTRAVSLQFSTQVFLVKGEYENFKELSPSGILIPYAHDKSTSNPDFNEKILNANLVFRWEYLPGSTIYLVWTQARYGYNSIYQRSFSDNVSDAFKLPMDNVILAKFSYWWSL